MPTTDFIARFRDPRPAPVRRQVSLPQSPPLSRRTTAISLSAAISSSWQLYKQNSTYLIAATLILGISIFLPRFIANTLLKDYPTPASLASFFAWIITFVAQLGFTNTIYLLASKQRQPLSSYYSLSPKTYLKYIAATLFYNFISALGLILFIIPGILLLIRLQFYPLGILGQNLAPFAALKHSWTITKTHFWKLLLFAILSLLLSLLGFITLGLGLLITVPLTALISIYLYFTFNKTTT